MGDSMSEDDGIALLGNALATWGILYVLITVLGPPSGAHFNPIVSLSFFLKQELELLPMLAFFVAQFIGGILGAWVAHGMFREPLTEAFQGKDRDTQAEFLGEVVSTLGLLMTIHGCIAADAKKNIPMAVGIYITAGYWFTSSTSFANPAVTVARTFTNTFASINPASLPNFFGGQAVGLIITLPLCEWMLFGQPPLTALLTLARRGAAPKAEAPSGAKKDTAAPPTWGSHYKHNVMFLCNHNSCRSQMADGWMRVLRGSASVGVASAGIVGGTAVKPGAIEVMREAYVDISGFSSDAMADFSPTNFDVVISCCGCGAKLDGEKEAWKKRPVFEDWGLDDPPALDPGDLSVYRRVRDESRAKVEQLLQTLASH
eukprot:CAMPEP_0179252684 /NCGR_PEP_ID=MMETSP0797-20121207/22340_1 /TAXON_ID=47934 /ORGANISM="Dinophysis acuminata, Strain DAEP01" /LENGTH=372 /DNA_ID=CAMNT_0020960519 /DNA_START=155 /DNA_END=1273 /DNA_ORIENTATION=+